MLCKRKGKFVLDLDFLEDYSIDSLQYIMRDVIVMDMQSNYAERTMTYWVLHPGFDVLDQAERIPEYVCTIGGLKKWIKITTA